MNAAPDLPALLARARAGDAAAADELCRKVGPAVLAAVRRNLHPGMRARYDSIDFVQDVWASVLVDADPDQRFDSPEQVVGFFTQVARNKVAGTTRQRFAGQTDNIQREDPRGSDGPEPPAADATPSQWAVAGERWDRLLAQFPPGHRVILSRLRDGYSQEDIAAATGLSLSTVNRVVRRLKELTPTN